MSDDQVLRQIRDRLGRNIDSELAALLENPATRLALRVLGGSSIDRMVELLAEQNERLTLTARAIPAMARSGWAPSSTMPSEAVEIAGTAGTRDLDETDEAAIEEAWARSTLLRRIGPRLVTLGAPDDELLLIARERSRLVSTAWNCHERGEYAASVPIVLAQIDGIVHDATTTNDVKGGRSLFSKGKQTDNAVADDATIAGINEALPAVRGWFFDQADRTSIQGSLNRNAVLHGRELAYDTRRNSIKAFVLLAAVWEWANHAMSEMAQMRKAERYRKHTGSDHVDANGWRLDRRGFVETRLALRNLAHAQHSFRKMHGRTASLSELESDALTRNLAKGNELNQAQLHREEDGCWWAHSTSESGWVFAIGSLPTDHLDLFYFDAQEPPKISPPAKNWRTSDDGNWSGDCHW